ncbi:PACE efflux transporter [Acinetobacter sp.]|jgi:uncharacterized membrane protein|uniref:PACE efflux transporter n=1 Tax=Acinetobacter sp. TaxID=472 RepID=UPI002820E6E2|nr:PACE efflux transporter [Acinetobacter sp.]MDR0236036.1 PACE efflux transporter [Acinetobacter sp.]
MQGLKRRVVYVGAYEIIGLSISSIGLALLSGTQLSHTGPLAIFITTIAVSWNFIYNLIFEAWEKRQILRQRTVKRRIAHAIGFQLTLIIFLIPLIAWWMKISLVDAFLLDAALIVIIPIYTFIFNWFFDRIFGLPLSAQV